MRAPRRQHVALDLSRLLELNRSITLAKFAVEKNDVVLTVALPTEHLSEARVKDALDALSYYTGMHYDEVAKLVGAPLLS